MAARLIMAALALAAPAAARAGALGGEAAACAPGGGPAIRANITGLKDRTGSLKLELYPATEADFLRNHSKLIAERKIFRRVWASIPADGAVAMCIRVPRPGRYALVFTHDRDGRSKFNFWTDGVGFPSRAKLRRTRPTVEQAAITVGRGVAVADIRTQYLRGIRGFAPLTKG